MSRLRILPLEERIVLDAEPSPEVQAEHPNEIVFVDGAIPDRDAAAAVAPEGAEVHVLDPARDEVAQIAEVLAGRTGLDAIHVVSHGGTGYVQLGSDVLWEGTLGAHAEALQAWGAALSEAGDLLLYGCRVGNGEAGAAFVGRLAEMTGADVAASDDSTGARGDWDLEIRSGSVEARALDAGDSVRDLATFTVTNLNDSGAGSLRQAVTDANGAAGADTVNFQAGVTGTITLTTGQIPVYDSITVTGPGANLLTISGNNASRIFFLDDGTTNLPVMLASISGLRFTAGNAADGGAINAGNEALVLTNCVLSGNTATSRGGAIFQGPIRGHLTLTNCTVSGNTAADSGGGIWTNGDDGLFANGPGFVMTDTSVSGNVSGNDGGGIFFAAISTGGAEIAASTISNNSATDQGGGIAAYNTPFTLDVRGSTVSGNVAGNDGGGLYLRVAGSPLRIFQSTVSGNRATDQGGGVFMRVRYDGPSLALQVVQSTLTGNQAREGAGFFQRTGAVGSIERSTLSANVATGAGGGVLLDGGSLSTINSTISGNRASAGGAFSQRGGTSAIDNSTIAFNTGTTGIGGIDRTGGTPTLRSTIVSGNSGADLNGDGFNVESSLIQTRGSASINETGTNLFGVDPLLTPLGNFGGPTMTHALLPGSPALARGSNPRNLPTDQRGSPRFAGTGVDIGAFESIVEILGDGSGAITGGFEASPLTLLDLLEQDRIRIGRVDLEPGSEPPDLLDAPDYQLLWMLRELIGESQLEALIEGGLDPDAPDPDAPAPDEPPEE